MSFDEGIPSARYCSTPLLINASGELAFALQSPQIYNERNPIARWFVHPHKCFDSSLRLCISTGYLRLRVISHDEEKVSGGS